MTPVIAIIEPPITKSMILLFPELEDSEDLLAHLLFMHVPEAHVDGSQ